jgi:hypothetical protein
MYYNKNIYKFLLLFFIPLVYACGKTAVSKANLNIQYEIINLSPDLGTVNLFIDYLQVNKTPFKFNANQSLNQGYFYVPSTDTPYQIRSAVGSLSPLFSRDDILKTGAKYSLFIIGDVANNTVQQILTVDTATSPKIGSGKIRFLNVSPTESGGLDVSINGYTIFPNVVYKKFSDYKEVPVGNYQVKINETGLTSFLQGPPNITVQDGKLYTIYSYGYSNRTDSATFNAAIITNK